MLTRTAIVILLLLASMPGLPASAEKYEVEKLYKKVELDDGTLDEDGNEISFIFVETDLRDGEYKVEIGERVNSELYHIDGTDLYIAFRYHTYLSRFDEGILEWNGWRGGTLYIGD